MHSPLVGPTSWSPVARELERRGRVAVVPSLLGVAEAPEPQWRYVPAAVRVATSHLSYFEAAVPLPDAWGTRCPCAYLLLSAAPYRESATQARAYRWPVIEIGGVQHLAIATNPIPVTEALVDLECFLSNLPGRAAATE